MEQIAESDAVAIGPGIGTHQAVAGAFFDVLKSCEKPMVVDADGLNILAQSPEKAKDAKIIPVLTPHPARPVD